MKKITISLLAAVLIFIPALSSAQYVYYTSSAAAAAGAAAENSSYTTTTSTPATNSTCTILTANLRYQDTDAATSGAVTKLQGFLYAKGYLSVAPTGYFGPMTRDAVTKFQNQYGLVPNPPAFVGPQTRAKIQEVSCGTSASQSSTASTQTAQTSCRSGDVYDIKTGLRCNSATQTNYTPAFTTTSTTNTPTATTNTTDPLAAPIILPYMRILSIVPATNVASTSRTVTVRWEAQTITSLDLGLINNVTSVTSVLATSTSNDGIETLTLSNLADGNYSFIIYWPTNKLANAMSPLATVSVSSKIITIIPYPATGTTATTTPSGYTDQQAVNNYVANAKETEKELNEAKKKVQNADTPAEKQSALQELCSGFWMYLDPVHCAAVKLIGN